MKKNNHATNAIKIGTINNVENITNSSQNVLILNKSRIPLLLNKCKTSQHSSKY